MVLGHNPLLSDEPRLMGFSHTVLLKLGINAHVANPIMWYGVCDREQDKGQYLILKLICFCVGREAEQIGHFLFVSSAVSQPNSVVGYTDFKKPLKSLKLHASILMDTMGLRKTHLY